MHRKFEKLLVLENHSSLRRLYRVNAWIKRFIKRVRKIVGTKGPLETEELEEAEMYWMQVEQRQCYSEEFETLAGVGQVGSVWKVFDIVDGAPAVPSDVSGDVVHIWMLPSALRICGYVCVCVCVFLACSHLLTPALSPRASPQRSAYPVVGISGISMYTSEYVNVGFNLL
ncbi:hypothetical protein AVEN_111690-1 [Araneus ventricosus]|uniref:Uncharacterized protein n=1 Tax=Araneus ventricosus TaxID=182803 RepID=A0A4Y1ZV20_ARAVE|nr:hypothetical protein AVEN_70311-1 [Araneus ventricosus]GBL69633.1 hypothetical protein AVEN_111690-1 [Araneus ventricosus]